MDSRLELLVLSRAVSCVSGADINSRPFDNELCHVCRSGVVELNSNLLSKNGLDRLEQLGKTAQCSVV